MPRKKCCPEEIITKLREADILISQGLIRFGRHDLKHASDALQ